MVCWITKAATILIGLYTQRLVVITFHQEPAEDDDVKFVVRSSQLFLSLCKQMDTYSDAKDFVSRIKKAPQRTMYTC